MTHTIKPCGLIHTHDSCSCMSRFNPLHEYDQDQNKAALRLVWEAARSAKSIVFFPIILAWFQVEKLVQKWRAVGWSGWLYRVQYANCIEHKQDGVGYFFNINSFSLYSRMCHSWMTHSSSSSALKSRLISRATVPQKVKSSHLVPVLKQDT